VISAPIKRSFSTQFAQSCRSYVRAGSRTKPIFGGKLPSNTRAEGLRWAVTAGL
jgi:hypothetical protein